jgi:hypothetical protein
VTRDERPVRGAELVDRGHGIRARGGRRDGGQLRQALQGAIKEAIGHYKRLLTEMEEDYPYIRAIQRTTPPVHGDGPSDAQAAALRQFGHELEGAHTEQMKYLQEEIRKLQQSLDDYEKQEEQTAEGFRRQA